MKKDKIMIMTFLLMVIISFHFLLRMNKLPGLGIQEFVDISVSTFSSLSEQYIEMHTVRECGFTPLVIKMHKAPFLPFACKLFTNEAHCIHTKG